MRKLPSWSLVLLVGTVLAVAYVPLGWWSHGFVAQSVVFLVLAVGGGAAASVAALRRTTRRLAWGLIAGGLVSSALGDALWLAYEAAEGVDPPFPWIADGPYLLGWSVIIVGVGLLVRDPDRGRRLPALLDAGVVVLAGAVALWLLVAAPLVRDTETTGLALGVALAYPVIDLALLGLLAALLLDRRRTTPTLRLLALGAAIQLVSDVSYTAGGPLGSYASGQPVDLGWLTAYVLFAAAALHPSADRAGTVGGDPLRLGPGRVLLLWLAVLGTTVAAVVAGYPTAGRSADSYVHVGVGAVAGVLMATLVLARLALVARGLGDALDERQQLQEQLEHEADHDALTGLANRRRFTEVIDGLGGRAAAVVFVDLDRFKEVNDRLGHAAGDEVLQVVAARLAGALRPGDLAARLGGDEFAALLDHPADAVDEVAARLLGLVRAPIVLSNGTEVRIDASVGTAAADHGILGSRDLLHDADVAMYEAKRAGRSRVTAYSPDLHAAVTERLVLRDELHAALAARQFSVVYQPIVAVEGRRPVGVEALLRWYHPTRGTVPPDVFIALAEASGDILALGRFVLTEACGTMAALAEEFGELQLNVNVSAVQLHQSGFAEVVEEVLDVTGFDPRALTLEITESVLLEDAPLVRATVQRLRDLGIRFAVNDFGTGFSALRYLRDVALDELKVDRSFVWGIDEGPEEAALAFAILHLADSFDLATVAEGVETESQLAALALRGCDLAQGYLFSPPLPTDELLSWLAAQLATGTGREPLDAVAASSAT